jgi:serine/threonine-protein kinase
MAKEAAESFRRALATQPGRYEALLGLGRALSDTGDDRGAETSFRRAIVLQPSSFAAYNQLGAFYADRGRFRDAVVTFQKLTELVPDSYRAFSNLGGVSTMACDFPAALAAYQKASDLKPDDPHVASNLGMTELWTGRTSEAVTSLEKASREAPNDYVVWGNLGDAYRAARAPNEKAEECFRRSISLARSALELNPKEAVAHSFVATGLAKTGRSSEAAEAMGKALAIGGTNPNILSDAAIVAALAGKSDEAIGWLQKAVAAGYCPAIVAQQPEFASLRTDPKFQALIAARHAA